MTTETSTSERERRMSEALRNIMADCKVAQERRTTADYDFATYHAIDYARAALAERDDDDGLEMHDNSCSECGHPYKPGDETHYPECSRIFIGM